MWICMNDAFLSIVKDKHSDRLLVRARRPHDITTVFPQAAVIADAGTDYKYRAFVGRDEVAKAIADRLTSIDYTNFKNSVHDHGLHESYARFWHIMYALQKKIEDRGSQ